jgi:potassium-transporting ATPase KdpC subunit
MEEKEKRSVGREAVRLAALLAVLVLLLGLAYPLLMSAAARVDGDRADGRIIYEGGKPVGARDIGQSFTSDGFFHGRPSAAGGGYDAMASGASNLGPSNPELEAEARMRLEVFLEENPGVSPADVPVELVTASASGLDPDIGEEAALLQVPRVAAATGIPEEDLVNLVKGRVRGRFLGVFGQPRVNVLELNLEVQRMMEEVGR